MPRGQTDRLDLMNDDTIKEDTRTQWQWTLGIVMAILMTLNACIVRIITMYHNCIHGLFSSK